MECVLTLIANPQTTRLDEDMVAVARNALKGLGADLAPPVWLAPGEACDIPFALLAPEQADAAARHKLGHLPIDFVAQEKEGRRKKLLVADMDSTVVQGETLDDLAELAGVKERVAALTARSVNGEVDFAASLRERVRLLAGLDADTLAPACERIALAPGARALVQTMRANGAFTILVSGGFRPFTQAVREACGFHRDEGNDMEVEGGRLTGAIIEPILDAQAKLITLIRIAGERQVPLKLALAVGDGANDLGMLRAAGLGVAYRAKPVVAAQSRTRIEHGDLTALLYAQGYRQEEIVG